MSDFTVTLERQLREAALRREATGRVELPWPRRAPLKRLVAAAVGVVLAVVVVTALPGKREVPASAPVHGTYTLRIDQATARRVSRLLPAGSDGYLHAFTLRVRVGGAGVVLLPDIGHGFAPPPCAAPADFSVRRAPGGIRFQADHDPCRARAALLAAGTFHPIGAQP